MRYVSDVVLHGIKARIRRLKEVLAVIQSKQSSIIVKIYRTKLLPVA